MNRTLSALLAAFVCSGCFSRAPLPGADFIENRRAWASVAAVDEAALVIYLKRSFYRLWVAEYGDSFRPPTVQGATSVDPAAMAQAEGPVSALLLVQLTSDQLAALAPSLSPHDLRDLTDAVSRYQAPLQRRIERIGSRVAAAAGRSDVSFTLAPMGLNAGVPQVFGSRTVFVGPQLVLLLDDDSELAAVLGHEVAHITQGHTTAGATWNVAITTLQVAVAVAVLAAEAGNSSQAGYDAQASQQRALAAADLTGLAVRGTLTASGYTRDQERDADYYGLEYASRAGFEAVGALSAFVKIAMVEKGKQSKPEIPFLADHPGTDERIVRLTKQVGRVKGGDFSSGGLYCWLAPAGGGDCQTCCTSTSYCVTDCRG
jgi:Zn-dependent protease with chaperone function